MAKFFFGLLTGLATGVGLSLFAYFYVIGAGEKPIFEAQNSSLPKVDCQIRRITLKAELIAPDPLLPYLKKGGGTFAAGLELEFPDGKVEFLPSGAFPIDAPIGRVELPFAASCDAFSNPKLKEATAINIQGNFCYEETGTCNSFKKHLSFRTVLKGDEFLSNDVLDLGKVVYSRHFPGTPQQCHPSDYLLAGTIVPTEEFIANVAEGTKLILAIHPHLKWRPSTPNEKPIEVLATQELTFSRSGMKFALPKLPVEPDLLFATIRVCQQGESNQSCMERVKRNRRSEQANQNHTYFQLVPQNASIPACGSTNVLYYLHWFPAQTPGSEPIIGQQRNPKLPPEIVEGPI